MTLRLVNSRNRERRHNQPKPCPEICPICEGRMEVVYARNNQQVCACTECGTGVTVPAAAWDRARLKRVGPRLPTPWE